MDIWDMSAAEILALLKSKEVSAREVLDAYLSRISDIDPLVGAYLEVLEPEARAQAARIDTAVARGELVGKLAGLPVAVKDNICVKGARCTCGSRILESWVAPYDATVIKLLRGADAVIIGKTNMDEFAMGSSTENSAFWPTKNPWDLQRVPGGSSGGSAAAVAAGMCPVALGSDTGGSIRQPASFVGVWGLKPTYGLVSRFGLVAFASSLDQIGPFGQGAMDLALVLDIIAGHDPQDPTSSPTGYAAYSGGLSRPVKGLRVGVPREFLGVGVAPGVRQEFEKALSCLQDLGVVIQETSIPSMPYALDTYYVIAPSEASSNLSRFDGVRYGFRAQADNLHDMYARTRGSGFGPEVRRRIMIGTFALSAGYYDQYYLRAARIRTLLRNDFAAAFRENDLLVSPTTPTVAFRLGERMEDPLSMYMADVLTVPANLAGLPALSMPCGFALPEDSGDGEDRVPMPCGLQIIGKPFDEETVLRLAYALETEIGDSVTSKLREARAKLRRIEECEPVVR